MLYHFESPQMITKSYRNWLPTDNDSRLPLGTSTRELSDPLQVATTSNFRFKTCDIQVMFGLTNKTNTGTSFDSKERRVPVWARRRDL